MSPGFRLSTSIYHKVAALIIGAPWKEYTFSGVFIGHMWLLESESGQMYVLGLIRREF